MIDGKSNSVTKLEKLLLSSWQYNASVKCFKLFYRLFFIGTMNYYEDIILDRQINEKIKTFSAQCPLKMCKHLSVHLLAKYWFEYVKHCSSRRITWQCKFELFFRKKVSMSSYYCRTGCMKCTFRFSSKHRHFVTCLWFLSSIAVNIFIEKDKMIYIKLRLISVLERINFTRTSELDLSGELVEF